MRGVLQLAAMAAGTMDHRWGAQALLLYHLPPPHWIPQVVRASLTGTQTPHCAVVQRL
jgi:hypothetical protein